MGIAFLGLVGVWALIQSDIVGARRRALAAAGAVGAGRLAGLLATTLRQPPARRHRTGWVDTRSDPRRGRHHRDLGGLRGADLPGTRELGTSHGESLGARAVSWLTRELRVAPQDARRAPASPRGRRRRVRVVAEQAVHPGVEERPDLGAQVAGGVRVGADAEVGRQNWFSTRSVQTCTSSRSGARRAPGRTARRSRRWRVAREHQVLVRADPVGVLAISLSPAGSQGPVGARVTRRHEVVRRPVASISCTSGSRCVPRSSRRLPVSKDWMKTASLGGPGRAGAASAAAAPRAAARSRRSTRVLGLRVDADLRPSPPRLVATRPSTSSKVGTSSARRSACCRAAAPAAAPRRAAS